MTQCGAISHSIVQVHPTRHCNLRCRHCYSASGPKAKDSLCPDAIISFLREAREQGYSVVSFSGGEPLLYPHLFQCALAAADMGLKVTVTTNGMLIDADHVQLLARSVDLIAISIDGPPDLHNSIRGSPAAFNATVRGLRMVRDAGIRFGIIHTITELSLPHLRWLYEFAREERASLLQLHPLEPVGRATEEMRGRIPSSSVLTRAYLLAGLLKNEGETNIKLQFDVFSRSIIEVEPKMVFADDAMVTADAPLSTLVNPLVLEDQGDVVPLAYGFGRPFRVCNIHHTSVRDAMPYFRSQVYPRFRDLCRTARDMIVLEDDLPYFNWYDLVTRLSCGST